jgi:hypothetical protein
MDRPEDVKKRNLEVGCDCGESPCRHYVAALEARVEELESIIHHAAYKMHSAGGVLTADTNEGAKLLHQALDAVERQRKAKEGGEDE